MKKNKVKLSDVTTYKFGGTCNSYFEIDTEKQIQEFDFTSLESEKIFVIGKGSNIVFSDYGYSGTVLKPNIDFIEVNTDKSILKLGSATFLPDIARYSKANSIANLEWLIGIPGSVGGATRMNAGAYGYEFSEHVKSVNFFNLETKKFETQNKDFFNFSYRESKNLENTIITSVELNIEEGNPVIIKERISKNLQHRKTTQPAAIYNAGSVFKNPKNYSAGYLIENAGLKGHSIGGVKVSEKHANFFVAEKDSKAQSLYDLVKFTKSVIFDKYGIELKEEIIFLGKFN
jgi:UDP-N-acetylmuramate dehydrogenase